jgi:hypothetical protein
MALRQMEYIAYTISIVAVLALACDWRQTLWSTLWAPDLFEANPLLGRQPSARRVNIYFMFSSILVAGSLAFLILYEKFGAALSVSGFVAALELSCVINNWSLGISLLNPSRATVLTKHRADKVSR